MTAGANEQSGGERNGVGEARRRRRESVVVEKEKEEVATRAGTHRGAQRAKRVTGPWKCDKACTSTTDGEELKGKG